MKKRIIINSTILAMLLLSGCEDTTNSTQNTQNESMQDSIAASVDKEKIVVGENVNFTAPIGAVRYAWYNEEGKLLSQEQRFNRAFYTEGEYKTILKVTYPDGSKYSDTTLTKVTRNNTPVTLEPTNIPPIATASISEYEICTGEGVTFYGDQSSDSDGAIVSYEWRDMDGILLSNQAVFDRGFPYPATYHKTLTVTDDQGAKNSMTVDLVVKTCHQNEAPSALPENMDIPNDIPQSLTLIGTDPEDDTLSYTVLTQPTHGTLSGNAPDLVYTPDVNYTGKDSFTFQVNDGNLDSNIATVDLCIYSTQNLIKFNKIYTYDANGNKLFEGWDFDLDGTADRVYKNTYDANGNVLSSGYDNTNDGTLDSLVTFFYDTDGNLLTEAQDHDNDGTLEQTLTYTYDTNGNLLTKMIVTALQTQIYYYTYDANNNLLSESYDLFADGTIDGISTYTYDTNGNLLTKSEDANHDGTIERVTTYVYDANNNLLSETKVDQLNGTVEYTNIYAYDADGNKLSRHYTYSYSPQEGIEYWTYDAEGNILSASIDHQNDGTIDRVTYFTYDADGNIIKKKVCGPNDEFESLEIMTYDADGNLVTHTLYHSKSANQ